MRDTLRSEFAYQLFALLFAALFVHAIYVTAIRPEAETLLAEQRAAAAADENYVPERHLAVVLRDFEQEACFILMLWAMAIMGYKARSGLRERALLEQKLLPVTPGMSVLPEDVRTYLRPLQNLAPTQQGALLPRALSAALQRFAATRNVQDVSEAVRNVCDAEGERLDSELSMVRYIAWAIPSIGFIGTVRGIGDALSQANQAVQGDITGVTEALGVAFNSTFVALLISILIMFLVHQLQLLQERLVLEAHSYADRELIQHLQVRT
jgi:biopolymer transport protein ExbB/TolQ